MYLSDHIFHCWYDIYLMQRAIMELMSYQLFSLAEPMGDLKKSYEQFLCRLERNKDKKNQVFSFHFFLLVIYPVSSKLEIISLQSNICSSMRRKSRRSLYCTSSP